ncbi:MBL fold metallo-hydrolase [Caulobacter sp. S45]|uniref:MBL fold metallo-hydrolase n=1 Tax=Caulobacter sp. S45 TaxID=1641861 RepID=UPI00131E92C3|nr:MBL fold metallo-hydrolase [Caulobacter sp. S45]
MIRLFRPSLLQPAMAAAGALLFVMSASAVAAQGIPFDRIELRTEKLAPNIYTLTGSPDVDPGHPEAAGGRIGLLVGPDGVVMVDAQYAPLSDKVLAAIRRISPALIRVLIDTHEHPDHTGGNPNFARQGAVIFAREETREELLRPLPAAVGAAASGTDPARLPVVTYGLGSSVKLHLDGETIDLIPLRAAHTGGDTMVRFETADVIMIGDFYRNYGYPFFDPGNGGSLQGVLDAVDLTLKLAGPDTVLVPGHGSIIHRSDLVPYRLMILDVRGRVQAMIDQGKTLKEVLAAKPTAPYDAKIPGALAPLPAGFGNSADRFVSLVYAQLKPAS